MKESIFTGTQSVEDEALLAEHTAEPGFLRQVRGMFSGPLGWVMCLAVAIVLLCFAGAVYAFWILFTTDNLMTALRWGVVAVVLVQIIAFLRGFMAIHLEANRILRTTTAILPLLRKMNQSRIVPGPG